MRLALIIKEKNNYKEKKNKQTQEHQKIAGVFLRDCQT